MQYSLRSLTLIQALLLTLLGFIAGQVLENCSNPNNVAFTIFVDKSGTGNFTTVQAAIDSIPEDNNQWIRIQISPGTYTEKVHVNVKKPCLYFKGAGQALTSIEWGDHEDDTNSATVSFDAANIIAKDITFKNTYNLDVRPPAEIHWKRGVSVRTKGDKSAFYNCAFFGLQDTLYDQQGRHYFNNCYIEGSTDFIFGKALSIYERCVIFVNVGRYAPGLGGFITAQQMENPQKPNGFVFKSCVITGIGKAMLGRVWGPYSTVIIDNSDLSDVVSPEGWNAWDFVGHEANFTYVEVNNKGAGADTSRRVPWLKKLDGRQLMQFLDMSIFINQDGWIEKLPPLN